MGSVMAPPLQSLPERRSADDNRSPSYFLKSAREAAGHPALVLVPAGGANCPPLLY